MGDVLVCPGCAAEHGDGERFCGRCGMPLVHSGGFEARVSERQERARKVKPQYAQGGLVRVAWTRNQAEAELIEGMLLEEGIPSLLRRPAGFDVPDFMAAGPRDILFARSGLEAAPKCCRLHALNRAFEQRASNRALECLDALRQARLADLQLPRCVAQRTTIDHRKEMPQLAKFQSASLSHPSSIRLVVMIHVLPADCEGVCCSASPGRHAHIFREGLGGDNKKLIWMAIMAARNPYEVLGVKKDAKDDEIRRVYRTLAKKFHPDLNPGNKQAEALFEAIATFHALLAADDRNGPQIIPALDVLPLQNMSPHADICEQRAVGLWRLATQRVPITILPVASALLLSLIHI